MPIVLATQEAEGAKSRYSQTIVLGNLSIFGTKQKLFRALAKLFGRLQWADHLRSGVGEQPGQSSETPSLLNIQKNSRLNINQLAEQLAQQRPPGLRGSSLLSKHFERLRRADHLRSRVQDQPDQPDETPSLLNTKKFASSISTRFLPSLSHQNHNINS
ncbi:hypothetical protein AAY473_008329 [Plecturocebus cupreus]